MREKVSVIIPVYNAERFLRQAVVSAAELDEVGEVILVEDASPDNALQICRELVQAYPKVKLYQHPGGVNRGAGASRNLGVEKASLKFLAFLDADDYYLPNRFNAFRDLFDKDETIDGVYDAVGSKYYDGKTSDSKDDVTTIKSRPQGQMLFETLLRSGRGHFHTNGIVVRKSVVEKAGGFNASLKLHQDSDLWVKISYHGRIVPGETVVPVAIRGVHGENRIRSRNYYSVGLYHKSLFDYFLTRKVSRKAAYLILIHYILTNKKKFSSPVMNQVSNMFFLGKTLLKHPAYILKLVG